MNSQTPSRKITMHKKQAKKGNANGGWLFVRRLARVFLVLFVVCVWGVSDMSQKCTI